MKDQIKILVNSIKEYFISTVDRDGNITSWNKGAEHISGYLASEIIGKKMNLLYPQINYSVNSINLTQKDWWITKSGKKIWAHFIINELRDDLGTHLGFGLIMQDQTTQKESEFVMSEKLKETQDSLMARDKLISLASHDLKTPLTALYMYLQLLQRKAKSTILQHGEELATLSAKDVSNTISICEKSSKSLDNLIDELLVKKK